MQIIDKGKLAYITAKCVQAIAGVTVSTIFYVVIFGLPAWSEIIK